jgi:predicted glycosyltransferase
MERQNIKIISNLHRFILNDKQQKTILLAPLDWGLGHATRCIPLIDLLLDMNHKLIIAGNGDSFYLLKTQYSSKADNIIFIELPGYNITYTVGKNAAVQSLLQTPKILKTIQLENKKIQEIISKNKVDLIISDNRYGVRNKSIKSILICHHIALQAPKSMQFINPILKKLHLQQIHKFDVIWIPDEANTTNLSGKLSHNIEFKIPHRYIGIQSRFANYTATTSFISSIDFSILIVLSGPEPQRTFLENELKKKLNNHGAKILLIRGKTEQQKTETINNITTINYLTTNDLYIAMQKAEKIICRSGYSTIMDLAVLGKKAIFIPAEGQTEQEYLAESLSKKGYAIYCNQNKLEIENALLELENIAGFSKTIININSLKTALNNVLI